MKRFKDLTFKKHPAYPYFHTHAQIRFSNGYGVSVVRGGASSYATERTYELAIIDNNGNLVYDTHITNDVIGHLSADKVTAVMEEIQNLPKRLTDED